MVSHCFKPQRTLDELWMRLIAHDLYIDELHEKAQIVIVEHATAKEVSALWHQIPCVASIEVLPPKEIEVPKFEWHISASSGNTKPLKEDVRKDSKKKLRVK